MGGESGYTHLVRLGSVLAEKPRNGYSPKDVSEWTGLQALGLGCLTVNGFAPVQLKNVPDTPVARRCVLADGDVLISRANTREFVGLAGRYAGTGDPCIYPDLMMRLRPTETRCLPSYLEIVLGSHTVRKAVRAGARGTSDSMVKISAALVEGLKIPLPSLDRQRRIVAAYDAFERRIRELEGLLSKLRFAEQALSAEVLSRGSEWDEVPLKTVATVAAGVTLGSEPVGAGTVELPYLRVANVLDGSIDTTDVKRVRILRAQYERYALKKGDLLLTEGGDLDKLGRGAVWDGRIEACLHQNHVFRVRCGERLSSDFLALYTASPAGRAYFQRVGKQTTNLASINSTQVKAMPVPVPPLDEQERLLGPIHAARRRSEASKKQIAKLRTVQRAVVEDLLVGQAGSSAT
ncbi:restriction endonuclease subunit S [Streptomyces europaeiscabiei]|uniref:restriction endonuclease subunit S n=1 Tax=Streptomyces europaeiscabiei TaxID=146819 RepID=UPI00099CB014|nr:restriction endonuclease subunit S [Streptomyces europaeiscabiei]MDX3669651.1 restriction endonuclease subunit S [Streptomyces europaeiscabiei]